MPLINETDIYANGPRKWLSRESVGYAEIGKRSLPMNQEKSVRRDFIITSRRLNKQQMLVNQYLRYSSIVTRIFQVS